jgi:hypothetical protein
VRVGKVWEVTWRDDGERDGDQESENCDEDVEDNAGRDVEGERLVRVQHVGDCEDRVSRLAEAGTE